MENNRSKPQSYDRLTLMSGKPPDLNATRAAKASVKARLGDVRGVCGIGITRDGPRYAVQVNLAQPPEGTLVLPAEVDGVPVVYHVVGTVHKQ